MSRVGAVLLALVFGLTGCASEDGSTAPPEAALVEAAVEEPEAEEAEEAEEPEEPEVVPEAEAEEEPEAAVEEPSSAAQVSDQTIVREPTKSVKNLAAHSRLPGSADEPPAPQTLNCTVNRDCAHLEFQGCWRSCCGDGTATTAAYAAQHEAWRKASCRSDARNPRCAKVKCARQYYVGVCTEWKCVREKGRSPSLERALAASRQLAGTSNPTSKVTVGNGQATLSSGDEARIEKIVRQYSGVFDPCYDLHHLPGEDLGRSVTLKWTLAAGQVTGVQGTSNTIGDLKMVSCMEKMLARWKFPADITGDVSWTFVLSHDGTPAP